MGWCDCSRRCRSMSRRTTSPIWTNSRCREAELSARQGAGELAYRFLVLLVSDLGEVAGDFEQHAMMRRDLPRPFLADAFVKIGDRCAQRAGDLEQPAGRDPVDAALVFVRLLVGHADHLGELLLGQTQHDAAFADPAADVVVYCGGRPPSLRFGHGSHPFNYPSDVLVVACPISSNAINGA